MLDKLYEAFVKTVTASIKPEKIDCGDSRVIAYAIGERMATYEVETYRNHTAGNLDEIIALANRFKAEDGSSPVVWYNREAVTLVMNDADHRDSNARLPLHYSDIWVRILELDANKPAARLDHADFIRLLRIELASTHDKTFLDSVRRIKWSKNQSTISDRQVKRSASGVETSAEAEVDGGAIAENITLSVPVYKTNGLTWRSSLRCSIEVIPEEAKLRLLPFPDETEFVQNQAIGAIGDYLTAGLTEGIPAYYGEP